LTVARTDGPEGVSNCGPLGGANPEISSRRFVVVVVETTAVVRAIPVSVVHGCFLRELWVAISWVRFKSREFRD
jgi:hypothetical protein